MTFKTFPSRMFSAILITVDEHFADQKFVKRTRPAFCK